MKLALLKRTDLEGEVDLYLDLVIRGSMIFCQVVKFYLAGRWEEFEDRCEMLAKIENKADGQLTLLEGKLYNDGEMREWRGDILGIVESTDEILNAMKQTMMQFSVENPSIPPELSGQYEELAHLAALTVESMVAAIRAYFRKPSMVRRKIEEVMDLNKATTRTADLLKRRAFRMDLELDQKFHLRYFAHHIEEISMAAENVTDRLSIATIKRYS